MDMKKREFVLMGINSALDEIVSALEENRFEPSERGAGSAPTDSAIEICHDELVKLVCNVHEDMDEDYLLNGPTLEEVMAEISSINDENTAELYDCLTEIDTFIRDNGERKYQYFNTVYQYKKTDNYISVEEQRSLISGGDWVVCNINVSQTEKKEKVSYEWS